MLDFSAIGVLRVSLQAKFQEKGHDMWLASGKYKSIIPLSILLISKEQSLHKKEKSGRPSQD